MNTGIHACCRLLLPVIAAGFCERSHQLEENRRGNLPAKMLMAVAFFGAAPDVLNPHLSLQARYSSWSHGFPFWLLLTLVLFLATYWKRRHARGLEYRPPWSWPVWLSGAYLVHLFCDAIAGGIAWRYPTGDHIVGGYYIAPLWWIPMDILCFLTCYSIFRVFPRLRQSRVLR